MLCLCVWNYFKNKQRKFLNFGFGNSLTVQWLELCTSATVGLGSFLVGELKSYKPRGTAKTKQNKKTYGVNLYFTEFPFLMNTVCWQVFIVQTKLLTWHLGFLSCPPLSHHPPSPRHTEGASPPCFLWSTYIICSRAFVSLSLPLPLPG